MNPILLGFLLALFIAVAAYFAGSLNLSGAIAALMMGTVVFGLGGIPWAVILLVFFISSSVLSHLFSRRKQDLAEKFSKGSRRDAWQVFANGGIAALCVFWLMAQPASVLPWAAFCGAFAAANADTWATEIGVLSTRAPRLITTLRPVPRGTSGGVTGLGVLAASAGSLLVGLFASWLLPAVMPDMTLTWMDQTGVILAILLAGVGGSLFDSLLGATVQAIYWCPACEKTTEQSPRHSCGSTTSLSRGWRWLDNDWVNLGCTLMGAGLMVCFSLLLF